MTQYHRILVVVLGIIILVISYSYSRDVQSVGLAAIATNPGTYGLFLGATLCIVGLLKGIIFRRKIYYWLGGALLISGYSLIYGGIDIISNGVEMRDALFSPGIALMGAGMFIIAKTWRGQRL